jgi:hypothetical protein
MNEENKILEELREISSILASVEKKNVFTVPENYFENLAEKISLHTFLHETKKRQAENWQGVPAGYFDTLSSQILTKIKREEAENAEESTFLSSLKDKNVFTVPEGYFDNLSENIISKIDRPAAKVIPISSAKNWWKYAAAAVVTGAIAVSSLQIFYRSPDMTKNHTAVTQSSDLPDYIQSSFQYKTAQQLDEGIASLSPDEIAKYLENNGNILDDEMLSNDVDPNSLPSEIDYLSDENTLNKYLNSLNTSGANK